LKESKQFRNLKHQAQPDHPVKCMSLFQIFNHHVTGIALSCMGCAGHVQVLQTLSIIIQNVRSETAVFFLFSNNHVNNIVDLDFDFDDEEVLGYYISFLKTISLKLNRSAAAGQQLIDPPGCSLPS